MSKKMSVAFICIHNSCRSQIAEALGKHLAGDVFESYSAGSETKPQINQDAVLTLAGHLTITGGCQILQDNRMKYSEKLLIKLKRIFYS